VDNGVLMSDIVSYELPFGILGKIAHPILVQRKLNEIFDFRFEIVEEIFK
jgi:hypothetical protein